MKGYVKIERWSDHGFEPQIQTYHMDMFKKKINMNVEEIVASFNCPTKADYEYWTYMFKKEKQWFIKYYEKYKNMLKSGIWVFAYGCKDDLLLNHLDHEVPKHVGYLPENTIVLPGTFSSVLRWMDPMPIGEYFGKFTDCFVPEQSLKGLIIEG